MSYESLVSQLNELKVPKICVVYAIIILGLVSFLTLLTIARPLVMPLVRAINRNL